MLYNSVLEKIILPIGDTLNGSTFISELKRWRRIQGMSENEIDELQRLNLKQILQHAAEKIPYYEQMGKGNEVSPEIWLKQFPIIKKHIIKADINQFIAPNSNKLIAYESSGSSGIQGKVLMNKQEQSIIRAILILWWEWAGYKIGHPIIQTGMTENRGLLKSLKDFFFNTNYFIAFGLEEKTINTLLESANTKNIKHLAGYASSLFLIAKEAGLKDINVKFESVISWGDKMFPHYRKKIESVFNTKVFDTYACNEGIMIAAQYDLEYYYIMSPHVYLEIVDKDGMDVKDGELGYVLVTRLDNFSMPLIRYYNGDLAVKLPRDKYPEKRKLKFPLLEKIIGRDTDIVKTRSGKYMIVHFFTGIFEFFPAIKQFRVIQKDLDSIEIEYIEEPGFDKLVLSKITEQIHNYLKEPFPIRYVKVDHIPPTSSGKPQIIKSELKDSEK